MHVLILGGTAEGRELAGLLAERLPSLKVTSSLAGRVAAPRLPSGEVRVGGFGGSAGLAAWLRENAVHLLIDATHPFAGTISRNAAEAAAQAHVPLLAVRRPGWVQEPGDDWHRVDSLADAARVLPGLGTRVFLTTGRTGVEAFAGLDPLWFLLRSVDPPAPGLPVPARLEVLLDRGPFTLDGERELLRAHRIDVLVTKDSGGGATAPKLAAARSLGVRVVVVRRPVPSPGVPSVVDAPGALEWVRKRLHDPRPPTDA
ncbi:cobalt-precorrin-6A reductase [Actinacidiphila yeochonensis]|uniref:cobalt-precorrin-6A reductase n=1 Tax=Actinacidiphila yeochonensis TaxID=89050 RepID=UPI00056B86AA|nr:cobalt-precorrin-6A reductase [Actinacidiphila yeochonensis]